MAEEFEGDLAGSVFWGADLRGARFRDVDLTGVRISHSWFMDVDIDALVDRVIINGVDVTAYVNERDPWYPLRSMLRASTPEDTRAAWAALEAEWATTTARALALPEEARHESVNGEFSFVQTVRHLVFAIDKWFTAPVLGEPFDPIGLPNTGSLEFPWPGLDLGSQPSAAEALAVWTARATCLREFLASVQTRTSDDRWRCSRTARTLCASASTPSSRRRSGTTVTRSETSRSLRSRSRDEQGVTQASGPAGAELRRGHEPCACLRPGVASCSTAA